MTELNVHIYCYDDTTLLADAVESVRAVLGDIDIHVCDGRYALFPGEHDLTPGLAEWCAARDGVHYHAPPAADLPFGHDSDAPDDHRPGNYAKARWVFDEVLPPDEWTLKLDADERLTRFDADLAEWDPNAKVAPLIDRPEDPGGDPHITRLCRPRAWTPWLDDSWLPRDLFPRDTPLARHATAWLTPEYRPVRFCYRRTTNAVEIENVGHERDADYKRRRLAHLERIGRDERAAEVRAALEGDGDA